MAVVAALRAAEHLTADDIVVVILPDSGRGYLGKIFNDKWMRSYGFSDVPDEATVHDIIRTKSGDLPDLVHAHPSDTVRDAIQIMNKYGVSQLPVLTAEPPVVMGEVTGALDEASLVDAVFGGRAQMTDNVGAFLGEPLGLIGVNEPVSAARAALATANALLVTEDGKPVAVLTRQDLLNFLSE
jgi:cystathionine beta-synthase